MNSPTSSRHLSVRYRRGQVAGVCSLIAGKSRNDSVTLVPSQQSYSKGFDKTHRADHAGFQNGRSPQ